MRILKASLVVLLATVAVLAVVYGLADPAPVVDESVTPSVADPTERLVPDVPDQSPSHVPVSADPRELAKFFAVVYVSPEPEEIEPEPLPASPGDQDDEVPDPEPLIPEANWLTFVGRAGSSQGQVHFYFRDDNSGRMRSIGSGADADYRLIEATPGRLVFEGPDDQLFTVEAPE